MKNNININIQGITTDDVLEIISSSIKPRTIIMTFDNKDDYILNTERMNNCGYIVENEITLNENSHEQLQVEYKYIEKLNLLQCGDELESKLNNVSSDEELNGLGFTYSGHLRDYEGYEEFYERLCVWTKVSPRGINIIATVDTGNCYCHVAYRDLYIKEIIDNHNSGKDDLAF